VSGWVAGMEQSMINADATLDLFDTEAGALSSAAAFPCRCDESRFVVSLYSERKAAFGAHHERLVEGAVSLLASRGSSDSQQTDGRWKPARSVGAAEAHVLH